eukprot:30938-Pelagococcus_subviridis.AAC.8
MRPVDGVNRRKSFGVVVRRALPRDGANQRALDPAARRRRSRREEPRELPRGELGVLLLRVFDVVVVVVVVVAVAAVPLHARVVLVGSHVDPIVDVRLRDRGDERALPQRALRFRFLRRGVGGRVAALVASSRRRRRAEFRGGDVRVSRDPGVVQPDVRAPAAELLLERLAADELHAHRARAPWRVSATRALTI